MSAGDPEAEDGPGRDWMPQRTRSPKDGSEKMFCDTVQVPVARGAAPDAVRNIVLGDDDEYLEFIRSEAGSSAKVEYIAKGILGKPEFVIRGTSKDVVSDVVYLVDDLLAGVKDQLDELRGRQHWADEDDEELELPLGANSAHMRSSGSGSPARQPASPQHQPYRGSGGYGNRDSGPSRGSDRERGGRYQGSPKGESKGTPSQRRDRDRGDRDGGADRKGQKGGSRGDRGRGSAAGNDKNWEDLRAFRMSAVAAPGRSREQRLPAAEDGFNGSVTTSAYAGDDASRTGERATNGVARASFDAGAYEDAFRFQGAPPTSSSSSRRRGTGDEDADGFVTQQRTSRRPQDVSAGGQKGGRDDRREGKGRRKGEEGKEGGSRSQNGKGYGGERSPKGSKGDKKGGGKGGKREEPDDDDEEEKRPRLFDRASMKTTDSGLSFAEMMRGFKSVEEVITKTVVDDNGVFSTGPGLPSRVSKESALSWADSAVDDMALEPDGGAFDAYIEDCERRCSEHEERQEWQDVESPARRQAASPPPRQETPPPPREDAHSSWSGSPGVPDDAEEESAAASAATAAAAAAEAAAAAPESEWQQKGRGNGKDRGGGADRAQTTTAAPKGGGGNSSWAGVLASKAVEPADLRRDSGKGKGKGSAKANAKAGVSTPEVRKDAAVEAEQMRHAPKKSLEEAADVRENGGSEAGDEDYADDDDAEEAAEEEDEDEDRQKPAEAAAEEDEADDEDEENEEEEEDPLEEEAEHGWDTVVSGRTSKVQERLLSGGLPLPLSIELLRTTIPFYRHHDQQFPLRHIHHHRQLLCSHHR
eukprot:TRINITY_DN9666_c0_g3_i1.p1 TRINITY_DN9666_c0_g3~~TRINITY_DN9666_c0_g3_i1.p1  ORF type:complete len:814 (-),score=224.49 TRINITY_DN9666_c0_g3_i1:1026-3467(-)